MEQIHAVDNNLGNTAAMTKLIHMLRDRNDKWLVHLISAMRKCGYLLDDVSPRLKEAGRYIFDRDKISLHHFAYSLK